MEQSTFPLGFSPTGLHGVAHKDKELGVSRAAAAAGVPMCLSSWTNSSIEDVVAQGNNSGIPYAMQLSVVEDEEANLFTIRKAEGKSCTLSCQSYPKIKPDDSFLAAGCKALWVTVDLPILGRRLNEYKNKFSIPEGLTVPNLPPIDFQQTAKTSKMGYGEWGLAVRTCSS